MGYGQSGLGVFSRPANWCRELALFRPADPFLVVDCVYQHITQRFIYPLELLFYSDLASGLPVRFAEGSVQSPCTFVLACNRPAADQDRPTKITSNRGNTTQERLSQSRAEKHKQ